MALGLLIQGPKKEPAQGGQRIAAEGGMSALADVESYPMLDTSARLSGRINCRL